MSTKRKYDHSDDQPAIHASRLSQVPSNNPPPWKKPRKTQTPTSDGTSSVHVIKKRMRDVTRKLRSDNLPADIRVENERALAAYEQELEVVQAEKIKKKMISKYHMVRFFERQKATKQLKKLKKRLITTESLEEVEEIKQLMHISEVDLNYAQYYPLSERYVSLFPRDGSAVDESAERKKPPMWAEIERRMEDGTLNKLRHRTSTSPTTPKASSSSKKKIQAVPKPKVKPAEPIIFEGNRRERRRQEGKSKEKPQEKVKKSAKTYEVHDVEAPPRDVDEGSDGGGFFEE